MLPMDWREAKAASKPLRWARCDWWLVFATIATLVVLPAIFALLQRDKTAQRLDRPDDPASPYFSRNLSADNSLQPSNGDEVREVHT